MELTNSNSELERFVFVASHDLQEPLRIVSSYLQLFEAKYYDQVDETGKKYIEFAVDAAERMKTLIRDLLQYSRIGAESLELIDVDMNEVIKDVLILLHNEITETNTQIVNETLPIIKAGKTAMLQLLQNLIGNAIKFRSSQTPIIKITAEEKEKEWLFSIKDNGIGIDPQYAEKIFIVFQRLHTTNEYKGTGIGLSICSKIMERYHGKIWVESELGKGATFHFMMPKPKD